MKNNYTIINDYVVINIINRKGKKFEVLIDLDDLPMLIDLKCSLYIWTDKKDKNKRPYAAYTEYLGYTDGKPKYKTRYLHRLICISNKGEVIDHENHNTLDNRRDNLRISIVNENIKNRKSKNSNNTSGYRNVSKVNKQWYVQLQIEGVNTCLKKFPLDKLEAAGIYAGLMREKYYGEFAGNN